MNMFKKNGGFTLVELIVVIAILAILAGIAVPAYSGYLKSAEKAGDITALSAVKTAATAALATTPGDLDTITVDCKDKDGVVTKITATMADTEDADGNTVTGASYILFAADGALATGEEVADTDFSLYVDTVADLGYYLEGTTWTAADGWAD